MKAKVAALLMICMFFPAIAFATIPAESGLENITTGISCMHRSFNNYADTSESCNQSDLSIIIVHNAYFYIPNGISGDCESKVNGDWLGRWNVPSKCLTTYNRILHDNYLDVNCLTGDNYHPKLSDNNSEHCQFDQRQLTFWNLIEGSNISNRACLSGNVSGDRLGRWNVPSKCLTTYNRILHDNYLDVNCLTGDNYHSKLSHSYCVECVSQSIAKDIYHSKIFSIVTDCPFLSFRTDVRNLGFLHPVEMTKAHFGDGQPNFQRFEGNVRQRLLEVTETTMT